MKYARFFAILGITLLLPLLASAQEKRIAIVTFYVDKYINADKIVEEARAATYELTRQDNPDFDLRPTLENFHETFINDYAKKFPFELVDESAVVNHPKYLAYNGLDGLEGEIADDYRQDRFIAIDGYKVLLTGGNLLRSWRTEAHMNANLEDLGIDGVLFVALSYQWEPKIAIGGMGNAGIRAFIEMSLYDKDAKKVFSLKEYRNSKKGVALVNGAPVMDFRKLLPLCEDATNRLLEDMEKELPKLIKKVDKFL